MRRAAGCIVTLALVATAAGAASFVVLYRPYGVADFLALAADYLPRAAGHPLVVAGAATALLATLAARFLERWRPPVLRRTSHVLDLPAGERPAGGPPPPGPHPPRRRARDVVGFVDRLLRDAITAGASDVHLQPRGDDSLVSLRIDGVLEPYASVPARRHPSLVRRLKVLAALVVYERARPQDGHFVLDTPAGPVDVRLSVVPTRHGEQAVMRLARGAGRRRFDDLGLPAGVAERLRRLLGRPEGLLVVTGPTGSGKTTTLYAALEHLHESRGDRVRLASIEDPVEVDLPFIAQTEVDRARGVGFAEGLRAVLRQDPNVLMIGEIRDPETAAIAVQAGLTGHLVLTTVHADGAAGVMNRLLDAGVEPYRAASSVLACLAQRLVPRLCPACRRPAELDPRLAGRLANLGLAVADRSFYRAPGCDACGGSGQGGRLALFELLEMTPELRQLVVDKVPSQRLRDAAVAAGMTSLAQAALDAAAAGDVDLDHALEVIG